MNVMKTSTLENLVDHMRNQTDAFDFDDDDTDFVRLLKRHGAQNIILGILLLGVVERLDELIDQNNS